MLTPSLSFREDMLIRIAADPSRTMSSAVAVARRRELTRVAFVLPAGQPVVSEASFLCEAERLGRTTDLAVLTGIEAPFRDDHGTVALSGCPSRFDHVYTSDSSFPLAGASYTPAEIRTLLATDRLMPADAVDSLVHALCNAMVCHDNLVLVEPFALLERVGLSQGLVGWPQLERLIHVASHTGTRLAVVENGRNPPLSSLVGFCDAGVEVVLATGTDSPQGVGEYRQCREIVAAVYTEQHRRDWS